MSGAVILCLAPSLSAAAPPEAPAPATAPAPKPAPKRHTKKPAPPPEPEVSLPSPDVQVRVIAPSVLGPWMLRIDNEDARPVRIAADARLLQLSLESGDTVTHASEPVECKVGKLRPDHSPENGGLLLAPGQSYVESFDPRLLCFGKAALALAPGAIVRARYGWEGGESSGSRVGVPYAVASTSHPYDLAAARELEAPTIVLNSRLVPPPPKPVEPPPVTSKAEAPPGTAKTAAAPAASAESTTTKPPNAPPAAPSTSAAAPVPTTAEPEKPEATRVPDKPPPVDENAPRVEVTSTPFVDQLDGYKVTLPIIATNTGHRPALIAFRTRMVSFRVDGPDGIVLCPAAPDSANVTRDGLKTIAVGASVSMPIIVSEVCGGQVFRRPGLYRILPTLHLSDSGTQLALDAVSGPIRAQSETLLRIQTGLLPFHRHVPRAVNLSSSGPDEHDNSEGPHGKPDRGTATKPAPATSPKADQTKATAK